jgi:hypothetical protein
MGTEADKDQAAGTSGEGVSPSDGDQVTEAPWTFSCHWTGCPETDKTEYTAQDWMSHVEQDHVGSGNQSPVCLWDGCGEAGPSSLIAWRAHFMRHVVTLKEQQDKDRAEKKRESSIAPGGLATAVVETTGSSTGSTSSSSLPQPLSSLQLEDMIRARILAVDGGHPDRIRRWLGSLLLVGGSVQLPGLAERLEERLRVLPDFAPYASSVHVLRGVPREADPRRATWKGASVLGRLESSREWFVTRREWDILGMRCVQERYPFILG